MATYSQEDVERLAEQMRESYSRLRRREYQYYKMRPDDELKFAKLARMALEQGFDGLHYIGWAFDFYRATRPIVYPSMIVSPKTLKIYREKVPSSSAEVALEIRLQIDTLRTQLALGRDAREVVTDTYLELGGLFRYALAQRAQLPELAARFKAEAELTMRQHHLYRDFYRRFLGSTE
jgi:hypothetical protein